MAKKPIQFSVLRGLHTLTPPPHPGILHWLLSKSANKGQKEHFEDPLVFRTKTSEDTKCGKSERVVL